MKFLGITQGHLMSTQTWLVTLIFPHFFGTHESPCRMPGNGILKGQSIKCACHMHFHSCCTDYQTSSLYQSNFKLKIVKYSSYPYEIQPVTWYHGDQWVLIIWWNNWLTQCWCHDSPTL